MELLPFSANRLVDGGFSISLAYSSIVCLSYYLSYQLSDNIVDIEILRIECCTCAPAPLQLLSRGYFACAPIAPSLAVDLQLLELVKTLFVHTTPNTTAWCETLEVFLAGRGYHLTTKVSQVPILSFEVSIFL
jgi:CxC1 like cysteine cluster associated with KDZ transposases